MKYFSWLWKNTGGFRLNIVLRIIFGVGRISLGLLTVWLSKRFIDETIRTGSQDDIVRMIDKCGVGPSVESFAFAGF